MKIYVYSDESGVFDKIHNDYFVFAGIIIIGDNDKIKWSNKYISAEKNNFAHFLHLPNKL